MTSRRQDILAVFRRQRPERIAFMLDLSHWFYHKNGRPWDLSRAYNEPEHALLDYHRKQDVGFYLPNLGSFFQTMYPGDVKAETFKSGPGEITWRLTTPRGSISRRRVWEAQNYAWGIPEWGIRTPDELLILADALGRRRYREQFDRYRKWVEYVGDNGVVYLPVGYSAMGQIMNYWMGIENTVYAAIDTPELLAEVVETINRNNLELIDLAAESPAEVILMGDNFSGDIQPPDFFRRWSRCYYLEAITRLQRKGKFVAVHIDGKIRGAAAMLAAVGADCGDALTPLPGGDLSPRECRREAGESMILSGGVAPGLWLRSVSERDFTRHVEAWCSLAAGNPRLIAAAGDQVPPHAEEYKIALMRDIVDACSRTIYG